MKIASNLAILLMATIVCGIVVITWPDAGVGGLVGGIVLYFVARAIAATLLIVIAVRIGISLYEAYSELPPTERATANKYGTRIARVLTERLKQGKHKRMVEDLERILREN